ncbi:MAG: type II toxin-antitoxin system HicA family toxin [Desulfovibrionaceae bacterium]|nr:type II toxin-antitoxin system HicA family toxin [Desulfovibrionaceae bacterium]
MTAHELVKRLEKAGFVNKGGRNHDKLVHPDGRVTVVHRHKGSIPLGTLKAIERQTKVKLT